MVSLLGPPLCVRILSCASPSLLPPTNNPTFPPASSFSHITFQREPLISGSVLKLLSTHKTICISSKSSIVFLIQLKKKFHFSRNKKLTLLSLQMHRLWSYTDCIEILFLPLTSFMTSLQVSALSPVMGQG